VKTAPTLKRRLLHIPERIYAAAEAKAQHERKTSGKAVTWQDVVRQILAEHL
jgi:hypothetical protein